MGNQSFCKSEATDLLYKASLQRIWHKSQSCTVANILLWAIFELVWNDVHIFYDQVAKSRGLDLVKKIYDLENS